MFHPRAASVSKRAPADTTRTNTAATAVGKNLKMQAALLRVIWPLVRAKRVTPALWTQTVQKKVKNVERHGNCVAFVDPLQPHTSSREFPLYKCVFHDFVK